MKKSVWILLTFFSFVFLTGMTHTDQALNYEITLPDNYIFLTAENVGEKAKELEDLGYYAERVEAILQSEQLAFGAFDTLAGETHKSILMYVSDLESPDAHLSAFSDKDLDAYSKEYNALYTEKGYTAVSSEILDAPNNRGVRFIKLVLTKKTGGVSENMIVYKTVVSGISYELVYNDNAEVLAGEDAAAVHAVFGGLRFLEVRNTSILGLRPTAFFIILAAVVIAIAIITASVIFTLRENKKKREFVPEEPEKIKTVAEVLSEAAVNSASVGNDVPAANAPDEKKKEEKKDKDDDASLPVIRDKDGVFKLRFDKVSTPEKKPPEQDATDPQEVNVKSLLDLPLPQEVINPEKKEEADRNS